MNNVYKLIPSELTFLWDECQRCFYLKVVHKFNRPWSPFPKIFNRIDKLMKEYYENKPSQEISSDLPNGRIKCGEKWVESQPINISNRNSSCFIRGKFDTVVAFSDGTYGVVDFKTSQPNPDHIPFYGRQLHAYAHALENPAPGKFSLSPISKLGLLVVEPTKMDKLNSDQIAYLGEVTWMEIPRDDQQFTNFLDEVLTILEYPVPPAPNPQCGYCNYRESARNTGW